MKQFIIYILLFYSLIGQAQIQHAGLPVGKMKSSPRALSSNDVPTIIEMPAIDSSAITYDSFNKTLKFAYPFVVDLSPNNCGQWTTNSDGIKIWQVTIRSEGASSLNIIFDHFNLPQDAKLFVYNDDMTQVIGAFTADNNKAAGTLPTLPVCGDEIVIEYQEPVSADFEGEINISRVNHDYTDIFVRMKTGYFGDAEACENDITCFSNALYQKIMRSTVKLLIDGSELMSGTLINNTAEDGTPYILTSAHGFENHNYSAKNTLFIFNYQVPQCYSDIEGTCEQSVAGGTVVAYSPKTTGQALDFALIKLSTSPPTAYLPYYAGWSRSSSSPSASFCVHHPQGDVKKISFDDDGLNIKTLSANSIIYYPSGHWNVSRWDDGVTEGGSSGSGLFNPQGQLIGALSAGSSNCSYPKNDYFFRFDLAWDAFPDSTRQLAYWLDPKNTDSQSLGGYESKEVGQTQRLSHITDSSEVTVVNDGNSGNIAGNNAIGINRFVEKYENSKTIKILGLYFVAAEGYPNSVVKTTVWSGSYLPETEVYSDTLLVKQWVYSSLISGTGDIGGTQAKDSLNMQENFIIFPSPIEINEDYFVGFEVDNSQQDYPFGLVLSHICSNDNAFYYDTDWHSYQDLSGYNKSTSLWIDPIVMQCDSSASVNSTNKNNFKIYPNPIANGELLTIEYNDLSSLIQIYDLSGRQYTAKVISYTSTQVQLNVDHLSSGVYILVMEKERILLQKL